jgi:hypothetical protein
MYNLTEYIQEMNRVYSTVSLPIVAASEEDADAGLPGRYPEYRYIQSQSSIDAVNNEDIVQTEESSPIRNTTWSKCAW